jgi:hypothetical protein
MRGGRFMAEYAKGELRMSDPRKDRRAARETEILRSN